MATKQALRIDGESADEMPHMRHTSFSCLLIVCREHSPRRILQSEMNKHHDRTEWTSEIASTHLKIAKYSEHFAFLYHCPILDWLPCKQGSANWGVAPLLQNCVLFCGSVLVFP